MNEVSYSRLIKLAGSLATSGFGELAQLVRDAADDSMLYRRLIANARSTEEHWSGRWSLVVDGPSPGGNAPAPAVDAALRVAMSRLHQARPGFSRED